MKNRILLILLSLNITFGVQAQTETYQNILKYSTRSSGSIIKNNKVEGYYFFTPVEKLDRKNTAYTVNMLDNNLSKVASFELVRPKKVVLMEVVFNDDAFMFQFYDTKEKTLEFVSMDRSGKQLGSVILDDLPRAELFRIGLGLSNADVENVSIWPLGNEGFVRNTYQKDKKLGYQIEAYDNNMKSKWTHGTPEKSEFVEGADVLHSGEKYVTLSVIKKKSALTRKFDTYFVLLDAVTGKELIHTKMVDNVEGLLTVMSTYVDEAEDEILIVGEYFKPDDDVMKDESLGLYVRSIDRGGEDIKFKKFGWDTDLAKFKQTAVETGEKNADKSGNRLFVHKFVRSKSGHLVVVAEQFRKQVSALGVLAKSTGGSASALEVRIGNMVVIEFTPEYEVKDYKIYEKRPTRINLGEGYGFANLQTIAYLCQTMGYFGYQFTLMDDETDTYDMIYSDRDTKDEDNGKKSDIMLGVVSMKNGKVENQRIPINSDAKYVTYLAAKPGYILIQEYYKKEKRLTVRLEKINV